MCIRDRSRANSTEFVPNTPHPVIDIMADQIDITDKGGTMRLGGYPCVLKPGTRAAAAYGAVSYTHLDVYKRQDRWCLVVSHDGRENSLQIHQDVSLFATVLSDGNALNYTLLTDRSAYLQAVSYTHLDVYKRQR